MTRAAQFLHRLTDLEFRSTLKKPFSDYDPSYQHYEVDAPALLKIVVDVPYVKSDTTVQYTEDGVAKD